MINHQSPTQRVKIYLGYGQVLAAVKSYRWWHAVMQNVGVGDFFEIHRIVGNHQLNPRMHFSDRLAKIQKFSVKTQIIKSDSS